MYPSDPDDEHEPRLPCAGGLVAGTLSLMTTWAAPEPDASIDARPQRSLIARKIAPPTCSSCAGK
jgi:hypothetical protein